MSALPLREGGRESVSASRLLAGERTRASRRKGYFFFGESHYGLVSSVVAVVIALFVGHAMLAVRKFPINYRQYSRFRGHMKATGVRPRFAEKLADQGIRLGPEVFQPEQFAKRAAGAW